MCLIRDYEHLYNIVKIMLLYVKSVLKKQKGKLIGTKNKNNTGVRLTPETAAPVGALPWILKLYRRMSRKPMTSRLLPGRLQCTSALKKQRAVSAQRPDSAVIAADTIVAAHGGVLEKPKDEDDAENMLKKLFRLMARGCIQAYASCTKA